MIDHKCIIKEGSVLYRYDLMEPPVNWDSDYKSIEYTYKKFGKAKNAASNFFFFSNEDVAKNTAKVALSKQGKKEYWLTTATNSRDLTLFCLCGDDIFFNLLKLYESDINVFTDDFLISFDMEDKFFSILKEPLEEFVECDVSDVERKIELRNRLVQPFENSSCPFGILGQTLTDFDNGIFFSNLLAEKGFDGYVFDESDGGHTICLINDVVMKSPTALSSPQKEKIVL